MNDAFAEPRDLPTSRPLQVVPENDFVVKQRPEDPYGFWWIGRERGQVPDELSGAYTSIEIARQAVTVHLQKQPKKKDK